MYDEMADKEISVCVSNLSGLTAEKLIARIGKLAKKVEGITRLIMEQYHVLDGDGEYYNFALEGGSTQGITVVFIETFTFPIFWENDEQLKHHKFPKVRVEIPAFASAEDMLLAFAILKDLTEAFPESTIGLGRYGDDGEFNLSETNLDALTQSRIDNVKYVIEHSTSEDRFKINGVKHMFKLSLPCRRG